MKQKGQLFDFAMFKRGVQVAAKIVNEWILAVVVGGDKDNMEVEDIEDDEDHPGTKKF